MCTLIIGWLYFANIEVNNEESGAILIALLLTFIVELAGYAKAFGSQKDDDDNDWGLFDISSD